MSVTLIWRMRKKCFVCFVFCPCLLCVEVPGPGVEPTTQQQSKPQQWQHHILNHTEPTWHSIFVFFFLFSCFYYLQNFNEALYYPLNMSSWSINSLKEIKWMARHFQTGADFAVSLLVPCLLIQHLQNPFQSSQDNAFYIIHIKTDSSICTK